MTTLPHNAATSANSYFTERFGVPLPTGLREQGAQLSWELFFSVYGRAPGPLRVSEWTCVDGDRPAARIGPQGRTYQATIGVGERVGVCTAAGSGPVAALTTMLHERGIAVEMVRFHQFGRRDETATCVYGSDGRCGAWAIGLSPESALSAVDAIVVCANRLLMAA
jgi:hypothetical protein